MSLFTLYSSDIDKYEPYIESLILKYESKKNYRWI